MKRTVRGALALGAVLWGTTVLAAQPQAVERVTDTVNDVQLPAGERVPLPPQNVVVFDNGPLITHPGGGAGGLDASALQTSATPPMNILGYGALAPNQRMADDFTVPAGQNWRIDTLTVFSYQTNFPSGGASPILGMNVRIWLGTPAGPGSTIVFGDTTTNRMVSSTFSSIYRVTQSTLTSSARAIWRTVANIGVTLPPGQYWVDWSQNGTAGFGGPFAPPVTILGNFSTGNGLQSVNGGASYATTIDTPPGNGLPQGIPFILEATQIEAAALSVDSGGNGVLQPNEAAVTMAPSWRNPNAVAVNSVTGALSNFTGPAGPTYTIDDGTGAYGTIAASATQACTDCYAVTVTSATRPAVHWDAVVTETTNIGGSTKDWTLHVGNSFTDVTGGPFFRFIETLLHRGVTGGCTATTYCPSASTTREQMAVFVLISKEGPAYTPPACVAGAEQFADVPASSPFCKWIEELFDRGVVAGCGGSNYCPGNPVTREQMAVFVLRTLDPALSPPACAPPNLFADVPETSPFCRWIEELANRSVVTGCGGGNYCPVASVTREQMGVFLAATFSLTLYGV